MVRIYIVMLLLFSLLATGCIEAHKPAVYNDNQEDLTITCVISDGSKCTVRIPPKKVFWFGIGKNLKMESFSMRMDHGTPRYFNKEAVDELRHVHPDDTEIWIVSSNKVYEATKQDIKRFLK